MNHSDCFSNSLPRLAFGALLILVWPSALLADARSDGERGIAEYRQGNLVQAMEWLQKSATAGYTPAQTTLASILDAAEDDEAAFRWYQAAADSNDAAGLFGLGSMYAKGEGTAKNPARAGELFQQAAELGHVQAMRVYANALENGQLGLAHNPGEAIAWYLKAANQGDVNSMHRLKQAYSLGQLGLQADAKRAAEWDAKIKQSN